MSSERQKFKIEDICEVRSGKRLPLGHSLIDDATPFPYIRLVDIADGRVQRENLKFLSPETRAVIKRYVVNRDDVCLAIVGHTIGVVFYVDRDLDDVNLTENAARLTNFRDSINSRYLYYYLSSSVGQVEILSRKVGSAQGKLPLYNIKSLEIEIPSRKEQDEIAEILDALSLKINLLRETNATLEAIAQALFKSWFVDFDPVRAKMEGRVPEGMDEATAALFPDELEESELRAVPRGWRVDSVYAAAQLIYGAPFASKQFNSTGVGKPLIRIRDLRDESPVVFTPEVHPKGYLVQPGDIIVGMDGEFRSYLWGGEEAWLNQRVCVFVPKPGFPAAFVHRSIMPLLAAVEESETATTVIHLGKNDIDRFRILIPDERVLVAFNFVTDGLYRRIVESKQCARTLSTLRETLLPRLISGQLRLPEAKAQFDALAA